MLPSGSTIIGHIHKAHGLQGMLLVHLSPGIQPNLLPRNPQHCWIELAGRWTPYRCMDFRLRIPNGLLIRLENILNPEQVRPLIQSNLALEYVQQAPQVKHFSGGEHWDFDPEDLGGGKLVDDKMVTVGNIVRVHRRPPQDFLEFTVGARSVYLPMVPEFVKQWHAQSKSLECHLPDGLLEIYLNSENENPEDGEHGFGNQVAESASSKLSPKDHVED